MANGTRKSSTAGVIGMELQAVGQQSAKRRQTPPQPGQPQVDTTSKPTKK